jgi:predicted nucleic acid-binding protein
MALKLLADTSALLALAMINDQYHRKATEFVQRSQNARLILTDLILAEVVTLVRARSDAARAAELANRLLRSRRYEVIFVDIGLMEGALKQMTRFADKRLSLTDCASFETMRLFGIEGAFSFDQHFRDCGFEMAP